MTVSSANGELTHDKDAVPLATYPPIKRPHNVNVKLRISAEKHRTSPRDPNALRLRTQTQQTGLRKRPNFFTIAGDPVNYDQKHETQADLDDIMKQLDKARTRTARGTKRAAGPSEARAYLRPSAGRSSVEHRQVHRIRTSIDCNSPKPVTSRLRRGKESPDVAPWSNNGSQTAEPVPRGGPAVDHLLREEEVDQV